MILLIGFRHDAPEVGDLNLDVFGSLDVIRDGSGGDNVTLVQGVLEAAGGVTGFLGSVVQAADGVLYF